MTRSRKKTYFLIVFFLLLFAGGAAYAGDITVPLQIPVSGTGSIEICRGNQCTGIGKYITLVYRFLVGFAAVLAVLALTWGGVRWLTSGGESGKIQEAQKTITNAIVGLLIAFLSYAGLITINPALVEFKPLAIKPIKNISFEATIGGIDLARDPKKSSGPTTFTPTSAPKSGFSSLKFGQLNTIAGRGSTKFGYGGDIEKVYASTQNPKTVFMSTDLDEKGHAIKGSSKKMDSKDHPITLIHEWIHSINNSGNLYVGNGIIIHNLPSPYFDASLVRKYVPKSIKDAQPILFGIYMENEMDEWEDMPFVALNEFSAYNGDCKESVNIYNSGKRDTYAAGNDCEGAITFIAYGLALARATEKHGGRYMNKGGVFKEALRFLIEDTIESYRKLNAIPPKIVKDAYGESYSLPVFDADGSTNTILWLLKTHKDAEGLRELAARWYNVEPHKDWTKKYLGFD